MKKITVIGAGLAGSEAAYYIAKKGYQVVLYEMRPSPKAYAHHTPLFGELVCSNSLKNNNLDNAAGLLKAEMRCLDSLIMQAANSSIVPAGNALAVDRHHFATYITNKIKSMPNIQIINQEVSEIPDEGIVIIASGPLTSDTLADSIKNKLGSEHLYFYDAAAPLIHINGIDQKIVYRKSRYDHGTADYLNCPFTKEEFFLFYQELVKGQKVELKSFEKEIYFENCMPIEAIARRGAKTLCFGPLKPVGLTKEDGSKPYAVVQLRQDNQIGDLYNMVGFQTNLTFGEQKRIFSLIPGLANIEIVRYGVMHRNTYICAPKYLHPTLSLKTENRIFFAGQISGVEGYIESACSGIIAGINAVRLLENKELVVPPKTTIIGSLLEYISHASEHNFQPMNANFGILQTYRQNKEEVAKKSIEDIKLWIKNL